MAFQSFKVSENVIALLSRSPELFHKALERGLVADDFIEEADKFVFEKMKSLLHNGVELNVENIETRLPDEQRAHWRKVFADGPITQNIDYYIDALKRDRFRKKAYEDCRALTLSIGKSDPYESESEILGLMSKTFNAIFADTKRRSDAETVGSVYDQICKEYDENFKANKTTSDRIKGISTGMPLLDSKTSGFCGGSVYTVAARTGVGKTTLACNFAITAAKQGKRVAFFTIEMTSKELTEKMISRIAEVPVLKIENTALNDIELDRMVRAGDIFHSMSIDIYDIQRDFSKLQASLSALSATDAVDMVVIDYVQLLKQPGNNFKARNYELGDITAELKSMAKSMGVPFVVLAQLGRTVDTIDGLRRPMLSDLKDSASIEMDSNNVFFIHEENNNYELIIAKNRKGQKGSIPLKVDMRTNKMEGADENQRSRLPYKDND